MAASCYRDMLVMVEQEKNLRRDLLEGGVTGKLTLNPNYILGGKFKFSIINC